MNWHRPCSSSEPAEGANIGGGCGQLWFVQEWMREHHGMARPSVGHGKPARHTPRACTSESSEWKPVQIAR